MAPGSPAEADPIASDDLRLSVAFRRPFQAHWWQSALSIVVGIVLWQVFIDVFHPNPIVFKSPSEVFDAFRNLAETGTLWTDIRVSLGQFVQGFACALIVGVVVGVVLGSSRRLNSVFGPWVTIFYSVPVIAISPVIIIWLGFGTTAKVVIVAVAAVFPILINTRAGVQTVDRGWQDVCTAFRASRGERFRYLLLPASVPYILAGVRLGLGRGLIALVFGDLYGAISGIGYLLNSSQQQLQMANVYVAVVILAIFGLTFNALVSLLERRFANFRAAP